MVSLIPLGFWLAALILFELPRGVDR